MSDTARQGLASLFARLRDVQYEAEVFRAYGDEGMEALIRLLAGVREIFRHVPYEMMRNGLLFYAPIDPEGTVTLADGMRVRHLSELSGRTSSALCIAFDGVTDHRAWELVTTQAVYSGPHLLYKFTHGGAEEIIVAGTSWPVNASPWECGMATPSFTSLEQALDQYVHQNIRPEQCAHLEATWRDDKRLAFVEKPEALMRRSLQLALAYALQGVSIRPEQNQSETKPVDLEITWWDLHRAAIVEIKWLGNSGPVGAAEFSTSYSEARARAGMKQLAEYLDLRAATTSDIPVMGYLFVFDARRRGLTATQRSISAADGKHFAMRDLSYSPEYVERSDMGRPYRCFMEPICS